MPISIADRKHRMPFGAQQEVADELEVPKSYVSAVMSDEVFPKTEETREKLRRVQEALAKKLELPVEDVFGPIAVADVA